MDVPFGERGEGEGVGQSGHHGKGDQGVHAGTAAEGAGKPLQNGVQPQQHGQTLQPGHQVADHGLVP